MIVIAINGKDYDYPQTWDDLTLETAMKLSSVDLPDVEDGFAWYEHIDKVAEMTAIAIGAEKDTIMYVNHDHVVYLFFKYLLVMIKDLKSDKPESYSPQLITEFTHKGKRYFMPESLMIGENVVLQHGQNPKVFIEASNLLAQYSKMRKEGIKIMPLFIASVVKEQRDELFDEKVISERAEQFTDLPMSIVWEVFFCTSGLMLKHMNDTLQSMLSLKPKPKFASKEWLDLKRGQLALQRQALREAWKQLIT